MLAIVEDFGLDDAHIVKEEWKSVARIIDRVSIINNDIMTSFMSYSAISMILA